MMTCHQWYELSQSEILSCPCVAGCPDGALTSSETKSRVWQSIDPECSLVLLCFGPPTSSRESNRRVFMTCFPLT